MSTFKFLKTKSKFGNIKTLYNGRVYDSKHEGRYARDLDLRLKGKDIKSVEPQVSFPIIINGQKICDYISDFVVEHNDGTHEVIDCKGKLTDVYKIKKKLVEAVYGVKIVEVYNDKRTQSFRRTHYKK